MHHLVTLTGVGVLCNASRQSLETSQTRNCGNLWRISTRRSHFASCMHPQHSSTTPWGKSSGSGNFNEDDKEVTFPRGGGWVPPRQPSTTPAPAQPEGGWVPLGPPSSTPEACSGRSRCGASNNTLAWGLHLGTPRINTFSGEAMPGKTEVSFEQWYHEVQCVKDH